MIRGFLIFYCSQICRYLAHRGYLSAIQKAIISLYPLRTSVVQTTRYLLFLVPFLLLSACAGKRLDIYAEQVKSYDQLAYVIDHGIHTAVVVDAQPLAAKLGLNDTLFGRFKYIEIGRGDAGFYQAEEETFSVTLKALFFVDTCCVALECLQQTTGKKIPIE